MSAYQFKPELIYRIAPSPEYPDQKDINPSRSRLKTLHDRSQYYEKFRNADVDRNRHEERFLEGRLFSHLRAEENKEQVKQLKQLESGADMDKVREKRNDEGVFEVPTVEYDEEYKLPYGLGYDKLIKKKTDSIDQQKIWNNKVMDQLVEKLGYMDYRDALVCNKYILETKRHKDYHQMTRAKILNHAMSKYN